MNMEMAANNCNPEKLAFRRLFNIAPYIGSPVRQLLIISWIPAWTMAIREDRLDDRNRVEGVHS